VELQGLTKTCQDNRDGPGAVLSETVVTVSLSTVLGPSWQVLVTQESLVSCFSLWCPVKQNYPVLFLGFLTVRNRNRIVKSGRISGQNWIQLDLWHIPR